MRVSGSSTNTTLLLVGLALAVKAQEHIAVMARGDMVNVMEDWSVLPMDLRAAKGDYVIVDNVDVEAEAWDVLRSRFSPQDQGPGHSGGRGRETFKTGRT